jgi:hypothetical protein
MPIINKSPILAEIKRTAVQNGGRPLGVRRFASETSIKQYDWYGKYWVKWSEAVAEAGFFPNRMQGAYSEDYMLEQLACLAKNWAICQCVRNCLWNQQRILNSQVIGRWTGLGIRPKESISLLHGAEDARNTRRYFRSATVC